MKAKTIFLLLMILSGKLFAIRVVGNGGGISEQNLVFAFNNMTNILHACLSDCGLTAEEKEIADRFIGQLALESQTLLFKAASCSHHEKIAGQWLICPSRLLDDDIDADEFLDLKESTLFLFRLFAHSEHLNDNHRNRLSQKIQNYLNLQSFHFFNRYSDGFEFQIFGYQDSLTLKTSILIQGKNTKALQLAPLLFQQAQCENIRLMQPYVTENWTTPTGYRVTLIVPYTSFCGTSELGMFHKKILPLTFGQEVSVGLN